MGDHQGARWLFHALPPATHLIADRGYDNDSLPHRARRPWHHALHSTAKEPQGFARLRRHALSPRHCIENMFARLKDWRRIAMRYDRCAHTFFSAIAIAATVLFWIS